MRTSAAPAPRPPAFKSVLATLAAIKEPVSVVISTGRAGLYCAITGPLIPAEIWPDVYHVIVVDSGHGGSCLSFPVEFVTGFRRTSSGPVITLGL